MPFGRVLSDCLFLSNFVTPFMQSKVIAAEILKEHCSNEKNRLKGYILPEELTSIFLFISFCRLSPFSKVYLEYDRFKSKGAFTFSARALVPRHGTKWCFVHTLGTQVVFRPFCSISRRHFCKRSEEVDCGYNSSQPTGNTCT